jgi:hypothetical protein
MCNKVDLGIECLECGYPYSEAAVPDREPPFPCDTDKIILNKHADKEMTDLLDRIRRRKNNAAD